MLVFVTGCGQFMVARKAWPSIPQPNILMSDDSQQFWYLLFLSNNITSFSEGTSITTAVVLFILFSLPDNSSFFSFSEWLLFDCGILRGLLFILSSTVASVAIDEFEILTVLSVYRNCRSLWNVNAS